MVMRFIEGLVRGEQRDSFGPKEASFKDYLEQAKSFVQTFQENFDSSDRSKTEEMYKEAKRIHKIMRGPMADWVYSGAFGREGTKLTVTFEEHKQRQAFVVQQAEIFVERLAKQLDIIRTVVSDESLEAVASTVLPLEGGHAEGYAATDIPATRKYVQEVSDMNAKLGTLLNLLSPLEGESALIRPEDLQLLASARKTLTIDLRLWSSFLVDAKSDEKSRYTYGVLDDYQDIWYGAYGKICNAHERTFSVDGLSESDKGIAWITGEKIRAEDVRPIFPGDVYDSSIEIPETFSDPSGYFRIFEITPQDLEGRTEVEIGILLKKKYYQLAKECHPDKNPGDKGMEERFKIVGNAYDTLTDVQKRRKYIET